MGKKTPKFIDLFAGIGGFRLAFEGNGAKCLFSSEWDSHSQRTYEANFGETPHGDITLIKEQDVPNHDILTGGFPCQPFSTIGLRQGFDHETQGNLFFDIERILGAKRPSMFLLENVKGLVNHDGGNTWSKIFEILEDKLKYKVVHKVLDSSDFGVPQVRKRVYLVGVRADLLSQPLNTLFSWPKPHDTKVGIGSYLESNLDGYSISRHLQKSYLHKKDDGRPQLVDKTSDFPVKTLVATYHKIQRLTGTFVKDGPTGIRLLSSNECKSIMGFPEDFIIPVSRTQMYRQMGNSVAVPVVTAIAKEMVKLYGQLLGSEKKSAIKEGSIPD